MRFDYYSYSVPGRGGAALETIFKPVIPINVHGPDGVEVLRGLVDTGSDETILPDYLVSKLGVRLIPEERLTVLGIAGGLSLRYGVIDFELRRRNRAYRWSAKVGFHDGYRVLLGHAGFLRHFTATFDGLRHRLTLKANGTFPAPTMSRS